MIEKDTLYIGGEWIASTGSERIEVISPHTEEVIATVPDGTAADIDAAVAAARNAFDNTEWATMPPSERLDIVARFSDIYAARMMDMAQVVTDEMGSPISFSQLAQAPAPWMMLNNFLELGRGWEWEETRTGMLGSPVIVRSEPVGVVAAIVPWNVPAVRHHVEARPDARVGLHDRAQARARDPARRLPDGRAARRGRRAGRRGQHRPGRS